MIVTKQENTITDLDLLTPSQHNSESVWASISLKENSKLIVGSFYRPPDKGIEPILNLETELSEITEKLRNNSKYTVMLGGDFNAANIDWDTGIVGTQWKEPARGGPCYELMSSTNAFQPFPPSGDSTPEVERCP